MSRAMSARAAISSARRRASRRSRAFWIAMPTLAAIVASSRASAGPNRPSASVLCTLITPIAPSLDEDRDAEVRLDRRADASIPERLEVLVPVEQQRLAGPHDVRCQALAEREALLLEVLAVLAVVGEPIRSVSRSCIAT